MEFTNENQIGDASGDNTIVTARIIIPQATMMLLTNSIINLEGEGVIGRNRAHSIFDIALDELVNEVIENAQMNVALRLSNEIYKNYERKPDQKINIKSHKYKLNNDSKDNCSICINELEVNQDVIELECKHIYCEDCITEWTRYKNICPVCRHKIEVVNKI